MASCDNQDAGKHSRHAHTHTNAADDQGNAAPDDSSDSNSCLVVKAVESIMDLTRDTGRASVSSTSSAGPRKGLKDTKKKGCDPTPKVEPGNSNHSSKTDGQHCSQEGAEKEAAKDKFPSGCHCMASALWDQEYYNKRQKDHSDEESSSGNTRNTRQDHTPFKKHHRHHHHRHHHHHQQQPANRAPETGVVMNSALWEGLREVDWRMRVVCRCLKSLMPPEDVEDLEEGIEAGMEYGRAADELLDAKWADGEEYYDCISPEGEKRISATSGGQHLPLGKRVLSTDHVTDYCSCTRSPSPPPPPPPSPPFAPATPPPSKVRLPPAEVISAIRSQRHTELASTCPKDAFSPSPQSDAQIFQHSLSASRKGGTREDSLMHRVFWNVRVSNTQSLPTLVGPSRTKADDVICSAVECRSESHGGSSSIVGRGWIQGSEVCGQENGCGGGAGGGVAEGELWRKLGDVVNVAEVLKKLWSRHKIQLQEALCEQERERSRSSRQDQSLLRARQVISSLRHQRRQLLQQMEHKEEEMTLALRQHKNEAGFLRRKVLGFLEEKKALMAGEEKCDMRLKSMLETLLSLYLDRERFLALDQAKQNKINELKLLVVRQQLAIEELQEQNSELHQALNTLMQFSREQGMSPHHPPNQPRGSTPPPPHAPRGGMRSCPCPGGRGCGCRTMGLSQVLHCERSFYLPGHSTSPELAAVTVYGIGGERSAVTSPPEEVFDASRHFCQADGDHHNAGTGRESYDTTQAEKLLHDLTLHGPGSATFTLSDLQP